MMNMSRIVEIKEILKKNEAIMNLDKIIENLNMFDTNVCCCYDGCPVYRTKLQECENGHEACRCLGDSIKILNGLKYYLDSNDGNYSVCSPKNVIEKIINNI